MEGYDWKDYEVVLEGAVRGTRCIITAKRCSYLCHTHTLHIATKQRELLTWW